MNERLFAVTLANNQNILVGVTQKDLPFTHNILFIPQQTIFSLFTKSKIRFIMPDRTYSAHIKFSVLAVVGNCQIFKKNKRFNLS